MMLPWQRRPRELNSPRDLPNLALWVGGLDVGSQLNNAGAIPANGEGVKLISDKSGNSGVNVLCLNGVAGNYASLADHAGFVPSSELDVKCGAALVAWTSGARETFSCQDNSSGQVAWGLRMDASTGFLNLRTSLDGTTIVDATSDAAVSFAAYQLGYVRATWRGSDGRVQFFTSPDKTSWVQLGTNKLGAVGTLHNSTNPIEIGSRVSGTAGLITGRVQWVSLATSIDGAAAVEVDFTLFSKLATSGTATTGQTVTINTSGATGARISGARDLVNMVAASQPILTIAASGNYLTFDGSNDYLKAAAFSLSQPETVYFVGSQVSWTSADRLYDGNGGASMVLRQVGVTPQLGITAGSSVNGASLTLATNGVVTSVFNGASSAVRVNRTAAVTGDAGTLGNGGGFTLGSANDGTLNANITAQEVLVYSGAHDKATQDRVIAYLANRNRIALT